MKRLLIDTYRIFLLQTSKVLWDIIGWSIFIAISFYYNPYKYELILFIGTIAGMWLAFRLYWHRGRKKVEEIEMMRPSLIFSTTISKLLVLFFFSLFIYGIGAILYYNFTLLRLILWFHDYFNTGANLSQEPFLQYKNLIKDLTPETLKTQENLIKISISFFWYFVIPVATALKLKLVTRIIFVSVFLSFISYLTITLIHLSNSRLEIATIQNSLVSYIFLAFYILMFGYLIYPKRTNFK